jgi:hypothetical protein
VITNSISKKTPPNNKLASLIAQIQTEVCIFPKFSFFRVLKEFNWQVDTLANEATKLNIGVLRKNGGMLYQAIP